MKKIKSFLGIAFALSMIAAMTISAATAIESPWGNEIETGMNGDDMTEAEKLSAKFNAPDPFGGSTQSGTPSATDKMLMQQGIDPILRSSFGDIYTREVHGITIYSPDGTFFPIGYSAAYKNYFFYGNVNDFRNYTASSTWYSQVMYGYLLEHAEDIPRESNTRFVHDPTDNFNSSSLNDKNYGGGYGNWLFALN